MAVVLEGWGVVAKRSAVEARLDGGLSGWFEIAPNRAASADPHLCVVAFMVPEDAMAFLLKLDSLGLPGERDGAYRDVALVGVDGPWPHACAWLRVGRYAGVQAVWMDGIDPDPLVVPLVWQPNSTFNLSPEEVAKRLKFLRRDGAVEVFLDTETGTEIYRGRTTRPDQLEPEAEARFRNALKGIDPLLTWNGPPRRLGFFERRRLAKGIRELEAIATDERWREWFFLGMARRAASDPVGALDAFEHAHAADPANEDVGRELAGQCLALGRGAQAVTACERNCSLYPHDAGLRANLALACVIAGDLPRARLEVTRAREMDPADKITRTLEGMIDDMIAGKRPRMTKYP